MSRRFNQIIISVALAVSVLGAMATAAPRIAANPESVGFSAERLERVDWMLQGYVDHEEIPGAVGLIARHGQIAYHKSFGHRDVESKAPMSNDVIFRSASMTKPITSVAAMMLWEEGRFQLRDPVSKFLPEFADMDVALPLEPGDYARGPYKTVELTTPISTQHLLTHTAGLANPYRRVTRTLYNDLRTNRNPNDTIGDYVEALSKPPLNFEPGERWEYGPATDVVGRLVELRSGMSLAEYFEKKIFRPLGMEDTYFYLPRSKVPRLAALYRPNDDGKIEL